MRQSKAIASIRPSLDAGATRFTQNLKEQLLSGSGPDSAEDEATIQVVDGQSDGQNEDTAKAVEESAAASGRKRPRASSKAASEKLPIKMLNDRILVQIEGPDGERKSTGGILIPATAQVGKRLTWAEVVAAGPSVRSMELGDRVLFNPEDRYEVEVGGRDYIILRERDIHAVAAERLDDSPTGLYL